MNENKPNKIYAQIIAVMQDISAVSKDRENEKQNYFFRGIDDVYNMLHPLLAKHGIFTLPTVLSVERSTGTYKGGGEYNYVKMRMRYTFFTTDGSFVDAVVEGEGMDSGDKAGNKAMAVAHKYALMQIFCIPTEEEKDPECDSPEMAPAKTTPPVAPKVHVCLPTVFKPGVKEQTEIKELVKKYKWQDAEVGDYIRSVLKKNKLHELTEAEYKQLKIEITTPNHVDESLAPGDFGWNKEELK